MLKISSLSLDQKSFLKESKDLADSVFIQEMAGDVSQVVA